MNLHNHSILVCVCGGIAAYKVCDVVSKLAQKSDLILVAPATANTMAKMATGLADDLVSTLLLAADPRKIVVAPSMNEGMWSHPATQRNAKRLLEDGMHFIGPGEGWQACRTIGVGRMAEPAEIVQFVAQKLGEPSPAEAPVAPQPPHFTP